MGEVVKSVLIIEQDIYTREAVRDLLLLEWPELNILTADSGQTGITTAQHQKPDLILLSERLPHRDSYQTAERLRQTPETRSVV